MSSIIVPTAKAIFTFEDGSEVSHDINQDIRIRGIRNKNMRPIGFKMVYSDVFTFKTLLEEKWFRSMMISEILPSMKQGRTYRYCDKDTGKPLSIEAA